MACICQDVYIAIFDSISALQPLTLALVSGYVATVSHHTLFIYEHELKYSHILYRLMNLTCYDICLEVNTNHPAFVDCSYRGVSFRTEDLIECVMWSPHFTYLKRLPLYVIYYQ